MKAKVISPFNDKVANKYRNIGEEFEVSKDRFEEIRKAGKFVVEVTPENKNSAKPKATTKAKTTTKAEAEGKAEEKIIRRLNNE